MKSISERKDGEGNDERMSKMGRGAWRFGGVVPYLSLVIAIGSMVITWTSLKNQEDHFAWRIISSQKPGNSGVGWALEHLHEKGIALNHVVLDPLVFFTEAQAADTTLDAPKGRTARRALETYAAERELDGIVLRYGRLSHTNFSHSSLKEADFREAILKDANFTGSNLEQAKFTKADLDGADLTDAILVKIQALEVNLERATATRADFGEAELAKGNLKNIRGVGAFFDKAKMTKVLLKDAGLEGASLKGVVLINADMTDAELDYADLTDADLRNAHIADTSFKGTNISGMNLEGAKGLREAEWKGAWAWADNADTMSAATSLKWSEEDQATWKEVLSKVVVYYAATCREAWKARVAEEIQSEDFVVAARLYRPPEPNNCRASSPTTVLNEEFDPEKVAYQPSARKVRH